MRILKSDELSQILGGSEVLSNTFTGTAGKVWDTAVENRDVIAGFLTSVSLALGVMYLYRVVSARAIPFDNINGE